MLSSRSNGFSSFANTHPQPAPQVLRSMRIAEWAKRCLSKKVRALLILKQSKVRVIVIDEVHNLLAGSPREQRVILQLFRHLSNELKASLVFLGIHPQTPARP